MVGWERIRDEKQRLLQAWEELVGLIHAPEASVATIERSLLAVAGGLLRHEGAVDAFRVSVEQSGALTQDQQSAWLQIVQDEARWIQEVKGEIQKTRAWLTRRKTKEKFLAIWGWGKALFKGLGSILRKIYEDIVKRIVKEVAETVWPYLRAFPKWAWAKLRAAAGWSVDRGRRLGVLVRQQPAPVQRVLAGVAVGGPVLAVIIYSVYRMVIGVECTIGPVAHHLGQGSTYVLVTDPNGHPVQGLTPQNFQFSIGGAAVNPAQVALTPVQALGERISVVLVIDKSRSMIEADEKKNLLPEPERPLTRAKEAAIRFVRRLSDLVGDRGKVAVLAFADRSEAVTTFGTPRERIPEAIQSIGGGGATGLYDAIDQAVSVVEHREGRRFVVLLTDGVDSRRGRYRDSTVPVDRARRARVQIYTVGIPARGGTHYSQQDLVEVARKTGGKFAASTAGGLETLYATISEQLTSQYKASFPSAQPQGQVHVRYFPWRRWGG